MKLLFLVVSVLLIWWALRLLRRPPLPGRKSEPRVENMVACHRCGLHIPEKEAVSRNGRFYCSEAHAREEER